jgi:hypothetical protein
MLIKNTLLLLMLISYIIPIIYVKIFFDMDDSISAIISNEKNGGVNKIVLIPMIFMGIFTILYEINRNDFISLIIILFLLTGIMGVIFINIQNVLHYFYAFIVFISIIGFMIYHTLMIKSSILFNMVYMNLLLMDYIIIKINDNIFYHEVLYILIFGVFYILLHFMKL